jgi:outer membrane protein assembly factor BamB
LSTLAVLLGSQDGRAYAVDAFTGALIWRSAILGTTIQAAPAAALSVFGGGADLVFVATRNTAPQANRLYALNAADGTVTWYFDNPSDPGIGMIVSSASVDNAAQRVFFTSARGTSLSPKTTWCLNYLTPAMCSGWSTFGVDPTGGGDIEASPILFQGLLFVSEKSAAGVLYKIQPGDGFFLPVFNLLDGGAKGFVFPQFGTANLFASTSTSTMSVDGSSGVPNWIGSSCVLTPSTPTAVPFTDWVFVGSSEGKLFQYSAGGTGCPAVSVCIGNCLTTIVGAPAYDVLKTMLYVGTDEGKIYGVRAPF